MKLKPFRIIPAGVALGVILLVCLLRWLEPEALERLELMTYDMRARAALRFHPVVATNLGFVFINEDSLRAVHSGSLGYRFGLLWPRQVYGRLVREMATQGARAVAFDIIMGELRSDHAPVPVDQTLTNLVESDEFFARRMNQAGNCIIALTKEVTPPALFLTNALAAGDITTEKDFDGILRRVQCFRWYTNWHTAFRQAEEEYGFDLTKARVEPNRIILRPDIPPVKLDRDGNFDLTDFAGDKIPAGMARKNKPFVLKPAWHMGVVLGAIEAGCDLRDAEVDLVRGRIVLGGAGGARRVIPVDHSGNAYVDWCLPPEDGRLTKEAIESLLLQDLQRAHGQTAELTNRWRGKLAVVGSSAVIGNNLTDRGATPISSETLLVSKHWNVANSIITGRFVHRSSLALDMALIVLLGLGAAVLTWELRVLLASASMALVLICYALFAFGLYIQTRYWIPMALPMAGSLLMTHVSLVTWRVVFEQAERRRVKGVLSTIVSPKVANVLLASEKLSLGGARREITVLFADVRGFTQFTDQSQERVAELVQKHGLSGDAAEAAMDQQARDTLATINLYLGLVADTLLKLDCTLDKFIGDCVMAFCGAPDPNPRHAVACVRAAIEAQRAVAELNRQRARENELRQRENIARAASGLDPQPLLPTLQVGTGINTGMATVGLMGSEVKQVVRQGNYTVFGREVNLASRLEGLSGHGHIFISETTYQHLCRDDPDLAATCQALPPVKVKGIASMVNVYEVPWEKSAEPASARQEKSLAPVGDDVRSR